MSDYRNQKIVIIGAGTTGRSLARFFRRRGATVTLSDNRPQSQLDDLTALRRAGVTLELGGHGSGTLAAAELVVVSPGVPLDVPALSRCRAAGVPVLGEIEIAWRELSGTMVAITGTNGKSTVTSLVGAMLDVWGQQAFVGGNLGTPLIDAVELSCDWQVVELSSFQLETIERFRPRYALLLNVSEDHLDRYPDMTAYVAAKTRIFENQDETDVAVLNADDALVRQMAKRIRARKIWFSSASVLEEGMSLTDDTIIWRWQGTEKLFPAQQLKLRGRHNYENVMAALIPLLLEGCPAEVAWAAAAGFSGLPHRMELLGEYNGANWFNDSKGTNIGSVVKSLAGLSAPVLLIAGGKDKQGDLAPLADSIRDKVEHLVLIGNAAPRMAQAYQGLAEIHHAASMHDAVQLAARLSRPGGTVLLSPGCSSFDMFRSYIERGEIFKREFSELPPQRRACV
jgi:UDP-N-acetylmuramoylalanine--D-glutamate ligase